METAPSEIDRDHAPTWSAPDRDADAKLADRAVDLARTLLADSLDDASRSERRRQARLGALLADPSGREMIFALTDQVVRIETPSAAPVTFADVVRRHPTTAVGHLDRLLLRAGALVAPLLPRMVMPLVVRRIKHETRGIVLPARDPAFADHLALRRDQGVRLNVNPLGEAILSDHEADERMRAVCDRIERSDVDYVSVKVSAIVANLDPLAFDHSLERIQHRLREVYRRAEAAEPRTFVNLDMEEYRDLELTLQSFMRVLSEPEFHAIDAGIVLQAYLPDSHDALERLGAWATERRTAGGGRIKVRLVKGANLAMERAEAELHGWIAAPYPTKADVDASYKAILDSALRPQWADSLRIGLASHNLFDIAWALTLGAERGALDRIQFEMLEGMAPSQARQVHAHAGDLLMYAPVVDDDDFDASIAYLTRRLDENTQPENFLRSLFTLTPFSPLFAEEAERFRRSVEERHHVATDRRRAPAVHDHGAAADGAPTELVAPDEDSNSVSSVPVAVEMSGEMSVEMSGEMSSEMSGERSGAFHNAADSDMTDAAVRAAIAAAVADPPRPVIDRITDDVQIDAIVSAATASFASADHEVATRRRWLLDAADLMERERAATIGLMAHDVAKTAHEADPEVSEAIDFCRYDATAGSDALDRAEAQGSIVTGRGVVVVVGPWNFPYAIPTGGVAAAIAAGNSVILKPAPESIATGAWIAEQFWRAGVPRDVLQLVVCDDGPVGTRLVTHPDVDTVVLTGSYDTASMFLDWRPELRLLAETSGKDALVITPAADLDQAIADLVRSAFGHAGQKCSAASLGIVLGEVYDDPSFRRRLRDAVTSLRLGPATDPATMMAPLVQPPTGALERALTTLEPGEAWLVEPHCLDDDQNLDDRGTARGRAWSPGVRLGVREGSWFHRTECFGPVLGLMRADDLEHAIRLQNATAFGLTGGIHSLDDAEVDRWLEAVEVGNAYVNRHITGAIVQRQPFGGWKRSSVGGGAKAGGPGYVAQFARVTDPEALLADLDSVRRSYETAWADWFTHSHDPSGLAVESNVLRYVPLRHVAVRLGPTTSGHDTGDTGGAGGNVDTGGTVDTGGATNATGTNAIETAASMLRVAAEVTGVESTCSRSDVETDAAFATRVVEQGVDRVRLLGAMSDEARRILHRADIVIDTTPPVTNGRLELQHWVKEQAISRTMHRHGRLLR